MSNYPDDISCYGYPDDEVKLEVCHWCEESIQEDDAYVASCLSFWHKECYDAQQDV